MTATSLTQAERYELLDRIAVGGMAEVFRAKALGTHGFEKVVAIKRILPELARDPEFEQRFIAEAKLAVRLSHANVVQVLDFGHLGGTLFIAMEFVDGLDLAVLLKRYRERGELIPLPAALHIAIEIARGLDFAHQRGVVHRDVSPSNILLSRAGEVKIADFGIAQAGGEARASDGRRRIMGKWRYMSPEQTRAEPMAAPSDLFSAAAVLYELFTGDKLFPGDDAEAIADNIRRMALPRASDKRPGLPPRLDEVLGQALERDPARRPQRAADVLRALIEISYESSIVASALDVADAVDAVCGDEARAEAGRVAIDDLIRAQLGPAADPQRATAVGAEPAPGTLVRRVDGDGVTHLELDRATQAAGPLALKRTGGVPAIGAGEASPVAAAAAPSTGRRGRWLGRGLIGLAGAAGVAVALWAVGSDRTGSEPGPVGLADAASSDTAELIIDSVPAGAQVAVDGAPLAAPTPTRAVVAATRPHAVVVTLAGYQAWRDDRVVAGPGERLRLAATLQPVRARLEVITVPPGATLSIGARRLGQTPYLGDDLAPGRVTLRIEKDGFHPEAVEVILAEGAPQRVDRKLRSAVVYGQVAIHIVDSWAEVSLAGKPLGRAPRTFKLPLGRHDLTLFNPASGKRKVVTVEAFADHTEYYSFAL